MFIYSKQFGYLLNVTSNCFFLLHHLTQRCQYLFFQKPLIFQCNQKFKTNTAEVNKTIKNIKLLHYKNRLKTRESYSISYFVEKTKKFRIYQRI